MRNQQTNKKWGEQQRGGRARNESIAVAVRSTGLQSLQCHSSALPGVGAAVSLLPSLCPTALLLPISSILAKLHVGQLHSAYLELPLTFQLDTILLFTACPKLM